MIKFSPSYRVSANKIISKACDDAYYLLNGFIHKEDFYDKLGLIGYFQYSFDFLGRPVDGPYIKNLISSNNYAIGVDFYKTKNPFSSAVAMYSNKTIYLNTRKLNRTNASLVGSLVHEAIHALDLFDQGASFGHGDNNWEGKELSAPYLLGSLAKKVMESK